jgi:hypothetical protein
MVSPVWVTGPVWAAPSGWSDAKSGEFPGFVWVVRGVRVPKNFLVESYSLRTQCAARVVHVIGELFPPKLFTCPDGPDGPDEMRLSALF